MHHIYLSREDFDKLRSGRGFSGGWPEVLVHCKAGVRPAGGLERFIHAHVPVHVMLPLLRPYFCYMVLPRHRQISICLGETSEFALKQAY